MSESIEEEWREFMDNHLRELADARCEERARSWDKVKKIAVKIKGKKCKYSMEDCGGNTRTYIGVDGERIELSEAEATRLWFCLKEEAKDVV